MNLLQSVFKRRTANQTGWRGFRPAGSGYRFFFGQSSAGKVVNEAAQTAMEEAQTRMQAEQENAKATKAQVDELLSWAQCFDKADIGTKHLIVSRLIERVDVRTGYKVHIKFKISLKQFLGQE